MTILENTTVHANGGAAAPAPRLTRPVLEREAPIRNWSTIFGPPGSAGGVSPPGSAGVSGSAQPAPSASPGSLGQTLSDSVGQGYRVINDYLSQGQRYAEAMRWPDVASVAGALPNSAAQDPQQLLRRLMQYGLDFAGIWFEVWSRMGWPPPNAAGAPAGSASAGFPAPPAPDAAPFGEPARAAYGVERVPERVFVSVTSERRVQSVLELRRGSWSSLVAHALRPEGHEAPAIHGVQIEAQPEQSTVRVSVEVPADQPPGVYNAMIIDTLSNLPRGTLTLTVEPLPEK